MVMEAYFADAIYDNHQFSSEPGGDGLEPMVHGHLLIPWCMGTN